MGCTYGDWRPLANAKIRLFKNKMTKREEIEMFKALMPMYDNLFLRYIDSGSIEKLRPVLLDNVRESSVRYILSTVKHPDIDLTGLDSYVSKNLKDFMRRTHIAPSGGMS